MSNSISEPSLQSRKNDLESQVVLAVAKPFLHERYDAVIEVIAKTVASVPIKDRAERYDYKRLKELSVRGLEEYQKMLQAPKLSEDAVLSFINQLSPWNLKTTGASILQAYVTKQVQAAEQRKTLRKCYCDLCHESRLVQSNLNKKGNSDG